VGDGGKDPPKIAVTALKPAVPIEQCPSGWMQSGAYCIEMRPALAVVGTLLIAAAADSSRSSQHEQGRGDHSAGADQSAFCRQVGLCGWMLLALGKDMRASAPTAPSEVLVCRRRSEEQRNTR
jgi:hypothetical protein